MKKIAIIGHFGGNENITDGQTVKTKILYEELSKVTEYRIKIIDTYYKKSKPLLLLANTLYTLFFTKKIIVLLSGNGMKFYFPLLFIASRILHTEVYQAVIGGNLDTYIKRNPQFVKYLNSFKTNWLETNLLKERVERLGVNNCEVIPNFKRLNIVALESIKHWDSRQYRFCTFSRVMREKGIEDAIDAIETVNHEVGQPICSLDIYGPLDALYEEEFRERLKKTTAPIRYCGVVDYDKSVKTIKQYYALLFPTKWVGEGFPGTIIDSFSAALPVIATDWNSNSEIIDNMCNGIIYPNKEMETLVDSIKWIISHVDYQKKMRIACINSAKRYQPDSFILKIKEEVKI